jgi:hypothetical protein
MNGKMFGSTFYQKQGVSNIIHIQVFLFLKEYTFATFSVLGKQFYTNCLHTQRTCIGIRDESQDKKFSGFIEWTSNHLL